ncbi:MAG: type I 3-dehydroquinate dehydratase [Deltaproteobacteria bacterium]|nr:type I 3-dehydroquinate dehydratase [Deltaproteobacteria bacterium]
MTGTERTFAALAARIERLPDAALHEVRLDLLDDEVSAKLLGRLPSPRRLLVTVRAAREGGGWKGGEEQRVALLREAMALEVAYVDVEASTPAELLGPLFDAPGSTRRIVSAHLASGAEETPLAALARLGGFRAQVLKLAVPIEDAAELCALRDAASGCRRDVIAIGTGEAGVLSRVAYRAFGSAWTYVAADEAGRTAPGQWTAAQAERVAMGRQPPLVYGLLGGKGALRSPGPRVYNALLPRSGRPLCYVPLPTARPAAVLQLLRDEVVAGLSVTMPHKEAVRDLIDEEAPSARRSGSVNTIVLEAGRLIGHSTDGDGAVAALGGAEALSGRRVLILGAGGAARAVARAVTDAGAAVVVASRRFGRAAALAEAVGGSCAEWREAGDVPFDVLINATPVGADGVELPLADPSVLAGRTVLDLVLDPARTPLLAAAARAGAAAAIPGDVMWAHQGAAQMRLLAGMTLDPDELLRAVRAGRGE